GPRRPPTPHRCASATELRAPHPPPPPPPPTHPRRWRRRSRSCLASPLEGAINHREQVLRCSCRIGCERERGYHRYAIRARGNDIGGIAGIDSRNGTNGIIWFPCADRLHDGTQTVDADRCCCIFFRRCV